MLSKLFSRINDKITSAYIHMTYSGQSRDAERRQLIENTEELKRIAESSRERSLEQERQLNEYARQNSASERGTQ